MASRRIRGVMLIWFDFFFFEFIYLFFIYLFIIYLLSISWFDYYFINYCLIISFSLIIILSLFWFVSHKLEKLLSNHSREVVATAAARASHYKCKYEWNERGVNLDAISFCISSPLWTSCKEFSKQCKDIWYSRRTPVFRSIFSFLFDSNCASRRDEIFERSLNLVLYLLVLSDFHWFAGSFEDIYISYWRQMVFVLCILDVLKISIKLWNSNSVGDICLQRKVIHVRTGQRND
jgi:hypothetical protein